MDAKTLRGIVHGNAIELESNAGIADGELVEVVLRRVGSARTQAGEGLLRTEGALADDRGRVCAGGPRPQPALSLSMKLRLTLDTAAIALGNCGRSGLPAGIGGFLLDGFGGRQEEFDPG